jgi:hypothetical protein
MISGTRIVDREKDYAQCSYEAASVDYSGLEQSLCSLFALFLETKPDKAKL